MKIHQALYNLKENFSWTKTYLIKACLLASSGRGVFVITERGKEVLKKNPVKITKQYLMQFKEFVDWVFHRKKAERKNPDSGEGRSEEHAKIPEENIEDYLQQLDDDLADTLLSRVMAKPPKFFEKLVVKILVAMGYGGSVENPGKAIGQTGDDGVDGVIDQDVLGLDQIYIQAKRWKSGNNVGAGAIRDFFGSLDNKKASKGLFVTTSNFTPDARETARKLSKRIVLIDGRQLMRLMIRYGVGCRVDRTLYIKKIDEDFFNEE